MLEMTRIGDSCDRKGVPTEMSDTYDLALRSRGKVSETEASPLTAIALWKR